MLNFFLTLSLFSFEISFSSITILLSLGHVSHFNSFAILYNLSQESRFACSSSKFCISVLIVLENLSSSVYLSKFLFTLFSSKIHDVNSWQNSLISISPHIVVAKSTSSILNSSIFSYSHSTGNGLLPNKSIYF